MVEGTLTAPSPVEQLIFDIEFLYCDTTVISPSTFLTQEFSYMDVANTYTFADWAESYGVCGAFGYTAELADTTPLSPTTPISIDSATRTFTIDTSLIVLTKTYNVKVTGLPSVAGSASADITFDIDVVGCDSAVISEDVLTTKTFQVYDAANTITFNDWTESMGVCGPFTYSALLDDGSALPTYVVLDPATRTFTIDTSQILVTETITVDITGDLPYPGLDKVMRFDIQLNSCFSSITTPTVIAP